jgi:hypothetical protein
LCPSRGGQRRWGREARRIFTIGEELSMQRKYYLIVYIFMIFVLLTGCAASKISKFPDCGVKPENLNSEIGIFIEEDWNTFKNGDEITFDVYIKNKNTQVVAPVSFNNQIFIYDFESDEWLETENLMVILDDSDLILDSQHPLVIYGVVPLLSDKEKENTVYICVNGNLVSKDGKSDNLVGASVKVKLHP